jgi:hypothetical protein
MCVPKKPAIGTWWMTVTSANIKKTITGLSLSNATMVAARRFQVIDRFQAIRMMVAHISIGSAR